VTAPARFPDSNSKAHVLNSWKEIASYLGRGVRTVQRYERAFALPVRRVSSDAGRGSVVAFTNDLDNWLRTVTISSAPSHAPQHPNQSAIASVHGSILEGASLRRESSELRTAHHEALLQLRSTVHRIMKVVILPPAKSGGHGNA
jgi:hypothetical protein